MRKILIALLIGSMLSGCSKEIEIKQASEMYKEKDGIEYYNDDLTKEELKIIKKSFQDKIFKDIIKECGIENMEVIVRRYVNTEIDGYGHMYFIDCYINNSELSLSELHLLNNIEDKIKEVEELINSKLSGLFVYINFIDIKELK